MNKKILAFLLLIFLMSSCQRQLTPNQAANRGNLKCGKHHL
jgi:type III secretory pathway lipoprotein EscJ